MVLLYVSFMGNIHYFFSAGSVTEGFSATFFVVPLALKNATNFFPICHNLLELSKWMYKVLVVPHTSILFFFLLYVKCLYFIIFYASKAWISSINLFTAREYGIFLLHAITVFADISGNSLLCTSKFSRQYFVAPSMDTG